MRGETSVGAVHAPVTSCRKKCHFTGHTHLVLVVPLACAQVAEPLCSEPEGGLGCVRLNDVDGAAAGVGEGRTEGRV